MNAALKERSPMLEERVARIESDVEHIKKDVADLKVDMREMRQDVKGLREEFNSFKVDVTREFGALRTWMIMAGAGLIATGIGAVASLGRIMKWF
jgi:uncharacterized coiled-coil protein SlyX